MIGLIFFSSVGGLFLCLLLWHVEYTRAKRIFASGIRARLDTTLLGLESYLQRLRFWYKHLVWRWGWRTVIHRLLRSLLLMLSYLYDWLWTRFERNRAATQALRRERKRWGRGLR